MPRAAAPAVPPDPRAASTPASPRAAAQRSRGSRQLVALVIVVVLVIGVVALLGRPAPEGGTLGLGLATAKEPTAGRIVVTTAGVPVPADQLLVALRDGLARADADRLASGLGASVIGEIAVAGIYQLETSGRTAVELDAALAKARADPSVLVASANRPLYADDTFGERCDPLQDPTYAKVWLSGPLKGYALSRPYDLIGLPNAWQLLAASGLPLSKVKLGILDDVLYTGTGEVGGTGPAVRGDTSATAPKPDDVGGIGHPAAVANMMVGNPDNGGVAGVAGPLKANAEIVTANIFKTVLPDVPATIPQAAIINQARHAAWTMTAIAAAADEMDRGATIINMSFGDSTDKVSVEMWRTFLTRAGKNPKTKDVLFVASAGNRGLALDGSNHVPGGLPLDNLISVGSVDYDLATSSFSNRVAPLARVAGTAEVSLAAPASRIMVGMDANGQPIVSDGTSFASPQVAGAAALLRSLDPSLSGPKIKEILVRTSAAALTGVDASGAAATWSVDPGVGGILRVDSAVLEVVNGLLAKQTPPRTLTLAQAEGLATIDVKGVAGKDALSWSVVASVSAVGAKGTDVQLDFSGQASIGGSTTKHLDKPGVAEWPLVFLTPGDSARITVRRTDSGACARVSLKPSGPLPSPSPSAPAPLARGTLQGAFTSAIAKLGLPLNQTANRSNSASLTCSSDRTACDYNRYVQTGDSNTGYESSLATVRLSATTVASPAAALAAAKPSDGFSAAVPQGWTSEAHRGLTLWRSTNDDYNYGDGLWQGPQSRIEVRVAAGPLVLHLEAAAGCTSRQDKQQSCSKPALVGLPALDALLDEIVRANLVPAGTVR